ncbi:MAG: hypothetical protein VB144_12855 [Clostridia bacterium]|nr:hypothetical protein [Clostridia bacterium]
MIKNSQEEGIYWYWLSDSKGKRLSKKSANKFLLACILDYQIPSEQAWGNARRLAEDILGDPSDLWNAIADFSEDEWEAKFRVFRLHRFPAAHKRVWRIGRDIVANYDGDARKIWAGQSVMEVQERFDELHLGAQLGRMAIGALLDTGHLKGNSDVKADVHVRRVLGRIMVGRMLSADEAIELTRRMYPTNPWLLDGQLYWLGKSMCGAREPDCDDCTASSICAYCRSTNDLGS